MKITADAVLPRFREAGFVDYAVHDIDDPGEGSYPKYFGSVHNSGAYVILRQSAEGTFRWWVGRSAYTTAWAARAGLSYDYIYNLNLDA